MRFSYWLVILIFCVNSYSQAGGFSHQNTCFGDAKQTEAALENLRNALECAGAQSIAECRNHIAIGAGLAAVGFGAGVLASMKARILDFCSKPTASIFSSRADAAPIQCTLNDRNFNREAKRTLGNATDKMKGEVVRAKDQYSAMRDAARGPMTETEKAAQKLSAEKLRMRALLDYIKNKPGLLFQDPDNYRRGLPMKPDETEFAATRRQQVERYLRALENVKKPAELDALMAKETEKSVFGLFDRLRTTPETVKLMSNGVNPDAIPKSGTMLERSKFLDSIKGLDLYDQQRAIESRIGEFPELRQIADKLREVTSLQNQASQFAQGLTKLTFDTNATAAKTAATLRDTMKLKLVATSALSETTLASVKEAAMFSAASTAAIAEDASVGLRAGSRALANLLAFRMAGLGMRAGAVVVGVAASPWVFAADLVLHSAPGCHDEFASSNKCAVFEEKNKCQIVPTIGPNTVDCLYGLNSQQQMATLSDGSEFCDKIREISDALGPKSWDARCTNNGGFSLTSKTSELPFKMSFDTDSDGKISRMRYLGTNRKIGLREQNLGGGIGLTQENNFAIEFDSQERPANVLQLNDALDNKPDLTFTDAKTIRRTKVADSINGPWYKKDPNIIGKFQQFQGNQVAITEVQMCCTPTDADIDDICNKWHLQRVRGTGSSPANSKVQ